MPDTTAPVLLQAQAIDEKTLQLRFNEAMTEFVQASATPNGVKPRFVIHRSISGDVPLAAVQLTLVFVDVFNVFLTFVDNTFFSGEAVTVSYAASGTVYGGAATPTTTVQDLAGNNLATFTSSPVVVLSETPVPRASQPFYVASASLEGAGMIIRVRTNQPTTVPGSNIVAIDNHARNSFIVTDDSGATVADVLGISGDGPTDILITLSRSISAITTPVYVSYTGEPNCVATDNGSYYLVDFSDLVVGVTGIVNEYRVLKDWSTTVTTALHSGATEVLASVTLPGLGQNGMKIRGTFSGRFKASAAATKTLRVTFAGLIIYDSGALTTAAEVPWVLEVLIIRKSATKARVIVFAKSIADVTTDVQYSSDADVGALDWFTAQTLAVDGVVAAAGSPGADEIAFDMGTVEFLPAAVAA